MTDISSQARNGRSEQRSPDDVLVPITIALAPIRGLVLIDLVDDPTYRTLEPQVLAQTDGGTGLVLLAYRHDGRVELFADAGVEVDASGYDGLGEGLAGLHRTAFAPAVCEVTGAGLQVDLGIATPDGGRIEVRLRERLARGRDTIQMLAPVGGSFTSPAFFPFLWLPSLSFVPVRGTQVRVRIDGQDRRIARLPLPLGGRRCLMARYDPHVMVAQVNPTWVSEALRVRADGADAADATDGADGADRTTPGAQRVDVGERDGRPAIRGVTVRRGPHACAVRLDPPLPDPRRLPDGSAVGGTIGLDADGVTQLRGTYRAARRGDRLGLVLDRFGPWQARQRRPLLAGLFRLPLFRRWPTTYRWEATLALTDPPRLRSRWLRVEASGARP